MHRFSDAFNVTVLTEFVINPNGKSEVCILHEYMQRVLKVRPVYNFFECGKFWLDFKSVLLLMNNSFVFNKKDNTSCMICVQRTQVNPLEHQSLLMELLMAQELQAVKNLPRIKLVKVFHCFYHLWLLFICCHALSGNFTI